MIPILYDKNEKLFNTLGLGTLKDIIDPEVIEERNGLFYMTFKYPVDGDLYNDLIKENIVVTDATQELKNQRFIITRVTRPIRGIVEVYLEHISLYKTKSAGFKPIVSFKGNADVALSAWASALITDATFYITSDIQTVSNGTWELDTVQNARRVLGGVEGSILDRYGGEYKFDNLHVYLYKSRGEDKGVEINYGKNLIELTEDDDMSREWSSIQPYAIVHDTSGEEAIRHLISLPENILHSENANLYTTDRVKVVDFTQEFDAISRDETFDLKALQNELRSLANAYLKNNDFGKPVLNIKLSHVDLANTIEYKNSAYSERIDLCDKVHVNVPRMGIMDLIATVTEVSYNPILERYNYIRIGTLNNRFYTQVGSTTSTEASFNKEFQSVYEDLNHARVSAGGKAIVFTGPTQPIANNVGDIWFEELPDGKMNMKKWNGTEWEKYSDNYSLGLIEQQVSQVSQTAQTALENTSTQKTDISALQDRAGAIESDIVAKNTEIQDDVRAINTNIGGVKGDISALQDRAGAIESDIVVKNTAIQDDIRAINTNIGGVKGDISGIRTNIESLQGELVETEPGTLAYKLNDVQKTADGVKSNLVDYAKKTDLNGLASETYVSKQIETTENSFYTKLTDYAKSTDLDGLATETYVNRELGLSEQGLTAKLDNYAKTSDLTGLATETYVGNQLEVTETTFSNKLSTYAKTSDLTGLASESYVNREIEVTESSFSTALSEYAKTTDLDGLVSETYLDNQLAITTKGFDGKLTSYAKSSDLTGLATEEYARTQASAEAGKIEVQLTNYATKSYVDEIEVGGRNLLLGSDGLNVSDYLNIYHIGGTREILSDGEVPSGNFLRISGYVKTGGSPSLFIIGNSPRLSRDMRNKRVTISMYVRGDTPFTMFDQEVGTSWTRVSRTFTFQSYPAHFYIHDTGQSVVDISSIKIEKGNIATDWTPAPEDMASVKYTDQQIEATSESFTQTLTSYAKSTDLDTTKTSLNEVKKTADSNKSTIAQIIDGNTVAAFNNKVETAYGDSQIIKRDLAVGGETYELIRDIENTAEGTKDTLYKTQTEIEQLKAIGVHKNLINEVTAKKNTFLSGNETYPTPSPTDADTATNSFWVDCLGSEYYTASKDTITEYFRISFYDENGKYLTRITPNATRHTFITRSDARKMWISFPMNENAKVELGKEATPNYVPVTSFNTFRRTADETYLAVGKTNGNATSLQLTDGSILAGIVKDGATNKLHLTDQYFYGGKKFITDHIEATYAEMDNLRVNNTIDASNINVINLNAANITSGFMSSNRLRVDGDFEMRGKAIRFTNNGELSTIIDRERIHMYDQTNNARYVGSMGATRLLDYQDVSYMSLRHRSPSYMSLDYRGADSQGNVTYLPYVVFDAYKVNPYNNDSFFTRFLETTRFYKNTRFDGDNYFTRGSSALGIRSYTDRMFIGNMVNLTGLMIYRGGTIAVMENGTGKYNLHLINPS